MLTLLKLVRLHPEKIKPRFQSCSKIQKYGIRAVATVLVHCASKSEDKKKSIEVTISGPSKKPKFKYSQKDMEAAIAAVKSGESPFAVSKRFQVPQSTLVNKATVVTPIERRMGPAPALGVDVEEMISNWVRGLAVRGFPINKFDLAISVKQIVQEVKLTTNFCGMPGKKWLKLFLKRHPDICPREPEKLSKARAMVTEQNIRQWFKEVSTYVKDNHLEDVVSDPARIFNTDETGFQLCPKTGKVLAIKGQKNVYDVHSGGGKESITVLTTISANARMAPPMVVYPGQRLPSSIKTSVPLDWAIGKSDKGWMNGEVFYEYMANVFYKWSLSIFSKLSLLQK